MKASVAVGLGLFLSFSGARAALYNGNGDTSFGGAVGTGSLTLTDNGTTVSGTFTRGNGSFLDVLVIFIDSKSGGFSTTTGFTDSGSRLTRAISGIDGTGNRATADFASGFTADYAIALRPRSAADPGSLFQLVNNGTHNFISSVNISPTGTGTSSSYTFSFSLGDIGVTGGQGASIKFESSYIGDTGSRSLESFESLSGDTGWTSVTFSTFDTYITAVPEMTVPALAIFGAMAVGIGALGSVRRRLRRKDIENR
jgi:hypothetical protein